jgi:hypothetical protein
LVSLPLAATSIRVSRETLTEHQTVQTVKNWLAQTDYEPEKVTARGDVVRLVIVGEGDLPPLSDLEYEIERQTRRAGVVDLVIVPVQRERLELEPYQE